MVHSEVPCIFDFCVVVMGVGVVLVLSIMSVIVFLLGLGYIFGHLFDCLSDGDLCVFIVMNCVFLCLWCSHVY